MSPIEQLVLLLALHFVADFQLQSDYIAKNKSPGSGPQWPWVLTAHSAGHGIAVGFVLSPFWGVIEFVTHWLLDFTKARMNKANPSKKAVDASYHLDQWLHLLCKPVWIGLAIFFPQTL